MARNQNPFDADSNHGEQSDTETDYVAFSRQLARFGRSKSGFAVECEREDVVYPQRQSVPNVRTQHGHPVLQRNTSHSRNASREFQYTEPANAGKRGSVLQPFYKVSLCWDKINVFEVNPEHRRLFFRKSLNDLTNRRHILKDVSGVASAGHLIGVLGPKGCGKTTFIAALTGQPRRTIDIRGKLYINNQQVDENTERYSCFIPAKDNFIGTLTVKEHLVFHTLLRLGEQYSSVEKMALVNDIISELDLNKIASKVIGVPGRLKGLTNADRKRVSLATAAITSPPVLLCDEPTAGIHDVSVAEGIVDLLHTAAEKGKIVLCSITNPTSEIISKFHQIIILAEGHVVFFGKAREAASLFTSAGFPCSPLQSPTDTYLRMLSRPVNATDQEQAFKVKTLVERYQNSEEWYDMRFKVENIAAKATVTPQVKKMAGIYTAGKITQLRMLMGRAVLEWVRDPILLRMSTAVVVALGFLMGIFFMQQEMHGLGIQNINGALCLLTLFYVMIPVYGISKCLTQNLAVIRREIVGGVYVAWMWFVSAWLIDILHNLAMSGLLLTICYWLIGLHPSAVGFFLAWCIAFLTCQVSLGIAQCAAIASGRFSTAMLIWAAFVVCNIAIGGFFLNPKSLPWWLNVFR
ncbi:protein white-like [Paramacrobiotus metropolitanus]|uniref:protein white-like n=1 Tax=Paramacrobiotus metropolitanus TaxID=2943436 RepID=UPI002445F7C1|nr:protein white-like [Paramacrobiotus metropolitanus]